MPKAPIHPAGLATCSPLLTATEMWFEPGFRKDSIRVLTVTLKLLPSLTFCPLIQSVKVLSAVSAAVADFSGLLASTSMTRWK